MKKKITFILLALCVVGISSTTFAQSYAIDKKAVTISGTASFTSAKSNGQKSSQLGLNTTVNYFLMKHLFVGGKFGYSHGTSNSQTINGINIGPQIGYAFGNENSKTFPYLLGGITYQHSSVDVTKVNGSDTFFGVGLLIPVKKHIGINLIAKYDITSAKSVGTSTNINGNIFSIGVGISGLFFK